MTAPLETLAREYVAALERYVDAGDEPTLSRAYELGRRAMVDGLGVLDMAALNASATETVVLSAPPGERARRADRAAAFFRELLSPFEMSLRGYREANEELRRLNESLEATNGELESFSYSVSHDLRAPVRSIDGFSRILLDEHAAALDETGKKYLRYVRESAQRMDRLIDDLLALARVARTELHRVDVDLSALAHAVCDRLRASSPERACDIAIEDGVHAMADARLVAVLLENLFANAWKFTSKRALARIAFGREWRQGVATYFVRDNGVGFDMAHAQKLFGAFQRLHSAREFEGTGIGLATVQRVVHRHGGRVWAEAEVDAGASFYFTLGRDQER